MTSQDTVSSTYGVHSEVGRLHKVLVCAPGLAHRRLTPTNADDLVFDLAALGEHGMVRHPSRGPTRGGLAHGPGG